VGNAKPRVFHLSEDQAVINRYGFPSKGASSVVARLHARFPYPFSSLVAVGLTPAKESEGELASLKQGRLLSVNLGKNKSSPPDSINDYLFGVRTFAPVSDVLVVNVSSPNTPGLRNLQSRGLLIELLGAVVKERAAITKSGLLGKGRDPPKLLLKIAPDLSESELKDVAEAVLETGIDGVIVSNTTTQRPAGLKSSSCFTRAAYELTDLFTGNWTETGGLSGPPLKPLTLKALRTLRGLLPASVPLIGCGGISTGQDAVEYARAGATTVQLYTSFSHSGVGTPRRIKDEITRILEAQGKTWMDVVKEGQLVARKENKPEKKEAPRETTQLADRAGKVLAAGEELIGILKDTPANPAQTPLASAGIQPAS
jgi:dihydroorotate dehydrogenase